MIPFAEYNTSRMIWEQFKAERAQAHADHKKAVAMVEPFRELAGSVDFLFCLHPKALYRH